MAMQQKPDPQKSCEYCQVTLTRKRYGKRLEDMAVFLSRKFCGSVCMGLAKRSANPSQKALLQRAHKEIAYQNLQKASCKRCGSLQNLQWHHKDRNRANNDQTNLEVLCGSCHAREHWEEGKEPWKEASSCSVCGVKAKGLGLCLKHYQRFKKYGDPCLTKRGRRLVRESTGI